jgi:biopolymer transport protein ExbD
MAIHAPSGLDQPLSDLNTTPLIDVMLVLLVMMILSIPIATHSLPIDLPGPGPIIERPPVQPDRNKVSVTPANVITFNNQPVSAKQLGALLRDTLALRPEPELQFQPDPGAPYDTAAKVLQVIKGSGVSAFGFVGNEQFARFGKPPAPAALTR